MHRFTFPIAAFLALLAAPATLAQSERGSRGDPAELVPADALFYVGIAEVERTWEDFKKTNLYALTQDPAAKEHESYGVFATGLAKFKQRVAKALDVEPDQLKNPFKGPVAVYLNAPAGAGSKEIEPGLIAGVGDAALMKKYYESAVKKLKETAGKHETVTAGSNTIDVFTTEKSDKSKNDEAEDPLDLAGLPGGDEEAVAKMVEKGLNQLFSAESLPKSLALCLSEDRLIVAANADLVKLALRREKQGGTLAETDDHKALLKALKPVGNVRLLVNLPRLFEMAKAEADSGEDFAKSMKMLGSEGLRALVGHVVVGKQSYDFKGELLFLMKGERAGLARILSMTNRATNPPAAVKAETALFGSINVNIPKLLDEIERMIRQNDPAAADRMRAGLEQTPNPFGGGQPLNLRKDFIDYLREPLLFTLAIVRPYDANSLRFLISLGQRDREALVRFFSQFAAVMQPRELRGTQVFDTGGMTLAPTNDQLVLGTGPAVEAAMEKSDAQGGLAETPAWKRTARTVPAETWLTFYSDDRRLMESMLELAKNKEALAAGGSGPGGFFATMLMQGLLGGTDEKNLERTRKFLKYSGQTIVTATTTDDGVQLTLVSLRGEE